MIVILRSQLWFLDHSGASPLVMTRSFKPPCQDNCYVIWNWDAVTKAFSGNLNDMSWLFQQMLKKTALIYLMTYQWPMTIPRLSLARYGHWWTCDPTISKMDTLYRFSQLSYFFKSLLHFKVNLMNFTCNKGRLSARNMKCEKMKLGLLLWFSLIQISHRSLPRRAI